MSTTDPDVPVMKMGDGGFRPAANVELATDTGSQIITGVEVTGRGSDQGEMPPNGLSSFGNLRRSSYRIPAAV